MENFRPRDEELLREMRRVRRESRRKRWFWGVMIGLALTVGAGWFVFNRYYLIASFQGPAMGDTVPSGSVVVVRRSEGEPYRVGDLLLYDSEYGSQLKRVVAVSGDRIVVNPHAETTVNSEQIDTSHTVGRTEDSGVSVRRLTVPEDSYFMQGDQLALSIDSRYRDYDTITTDKITGQAQFLIWPVYRFGPLTEDRK